MGLLRGGARSSDYSSYFFVHCLQPVHNRGGTITQNHRAPKPTLAQPSPLDPKLEIRRVHATFNPKPYTLNPIFYVFKGDSNS